MQFSHTAAAIALLALQAIGQSMANYLLHSVRNSIGAGNSTYYKLSHKGVLLVMLQTLSGDTDLYVSDLTLHPNYENYEWSAASCGEDTVEVPSTANRPIAVAVFGHPFHEQSQYQLEVFVDTSDKEHLEYPTEEQASSSAHSGSSHKKSIGAGKEDEESILWSIFVGILKIIVDILV